MNNTLIKIICLLGIVFFSFFNAYSQDEFQVIESRIIQHLKADADVNDLNTIILTHLSAQQANGSWSDIDYASDAETAWQPLSHLKRIKSFALGFSTVGNQYYANQELLNHIINGLEYWSVQNPKSTNWFQNEIASPTAIGEILVLLNDGKMNLPKSMQDSLLQRMNQGNVVRAIGANKLDIATHMIYRACVTKDQSLMSNAVEEAFKPIAITNKEGLQLDYSYLQHKSQLQIASYGQVFLTGEYKVASWLQGTHFALSADELKILNNYLINTYLKTIRGRYIDFNTEGRGISRNDILDKKSITEMAGSGTLLALAKLASPESAELINAAEKRITQTRAPSFKIIPSHTQFWKGDYALHIRPTYSFNVRTVSKRTVRTEVGNKENLLGKFLPDGSTNIQRTGEEYYNIMPIWEWDKIPGITSRDYQKDQSTTIEWGERGVSSFVGGVSNSIYGTSVYHLDYNMVTAKKAWFYFDKQVVCLGADINSFARENIVTTINQSWQRGKIIAYADEKLGKVRSKKSTKSPSWVWHDSIGYYFPNSGKLEIRNRIQKGSWATVNANRSDKQVKGRVFKMWFNHGEDPVNESYAYVVMPGIGEAEMKNHPQTGIKILANNSAIQAVKNEDLNMLQIVFYEAGTLIDQSVSITVDQPCLILLENFDSQKPIIHLADPTQNLDKINVAINSKLIEKEQNITFKLPEGDYAGSTVSCIVD
jgi:chondroitin AC lyase